VGLKLNGTHQLMAYANDVNLLEDSINICTIKESTETLIDASIGTILEMNVEKTMYVLLSRHQTASQNHDAKFPNKSYENVPQFKY
jgi:hypothetical protein